MRKQLRNTSTIIIDEISMVSHETFLNIHRRLNEIKGVHEGIFFGNLNVIALGDLFQLPPVPPGSSVVECLTGDREAAGSSLTGVTALWSLCKTHLS